MVGYVPYSKHLLWCIDQIMRMDASEYDEPTQAEPRLSRQYAGMIETDSDRYVAHQYIVKHYGENGELYV